MAKRQMTRGGSSQSCSAARSTAPDQSSPCKLGDRALTIMYEQSLRTADQDTAALAQLRTHANILLSTIAIVGALVATHFPKQPHSLVWLYLALIGLGLAGVSCVAVIWPVRDRGKLPDRPSSYDPSKPHVYRERWKEWLNEYILQRNRPMLWKTQITYNDLVGTTQQSTRYCYCKRVECTVIKISNIAHSINAGTIGRRADLVRVTTGLVLLSLGLLIVWVITGATNH